MLVLDRPQGAVEADMPLTLDEFLSLPEDTRASIVVWPYRLVDGVYQNVGRSGAGDVVRDGQLPWLEIDVTRLRGDVAPARVTRLRSRATRRAWSRAPARILSYSRPQRLPHCCRRGGAVRERRTGDGEYRRAGRGLDE